MDKYIDHLSEESEEDAALITAILEQFVKLSSEDREKALEKLRELVKE